MNSILIIVPTLNSYQLLSPLVYSLQSQTFDCWRVLFIDGPSDQSHREWLQNLSLHDHRFQWEIQADVRTGIYGAMNQGFLAADQTIDWLLFWGSDDMASSPSIFEQLFSKLSLSPYKDTVPDLVVCSGRYFSQQNSNYPTNSLELKRLSQFIWRSSFTNSLFCGSTPPHQATLFGRGARNLVAQYDDSFRLAGDLDYFLRLSVFKNISVVVLDIDLVRMGDAGISGQQARRRLREVSMAYKRRFPRNWLIPFFLRYIQRIYTRLF